LTVVTPTIVNVYINFGFYISVFLNCVPYDTDGQAMRSVRLQSAAKKVAP